MTNLSDLPEDDREVLNRWRLVLGKDAERCGIKLSGTGSGEDCAAAEEAL